MAAHARYRPDSTPSAARPNARPHEPTAPKPARTAASNERPQPSSDGARRQMDVPAPRQMLNPRPDRTRYRGFRCRIAHRKRAWCLSQSGHSVALRRPAAANAKRESKSRGSSGSSVGSPLARRCSPAASIDSEPVTVPPAKAAMICGAAQHAPSWRRSSVRPPRLAAT